MGVGRWAFDRYGNADARWRSAPGPRAAPARATSTTTSRWRRLASSETVDSSASASMRNTVAEGLEAHIGGKHEERHADQPQRSPLTVLVVSRRAARPGTATRPPTPRAPPWSSRNRSRPRQSTRNEAGADGDDALHRVPRDRQASHCQRTAPEPLHRLGAHGRTLATRPASQPGSQLEDWYTARGRKDLGPWAPVAGTPTISPGTSGRTDVMWNDSSGLVGGHAAGDGPVLGAVVWLVVIFVRGLSGRRSGDGAERPDEILARRYARGEIDEDEYHRRLDTPRGTARAGGQQ